MFDFLKNTKNNRPQKCSITGSSLIDLTTKALVNISGNVCYTKGQRMLNLKGFVSTQTSDSSCVQNPLGVG